MHRTLIWLVCCMSVSGLLDTELAIAQAPYKYVLVKASGEGGGLLRARGAQCFAITPSHVLKVGSPIRLSTPDYRSWKGGYVKYFLDKLAAVEVKHLGENDCGQLRITDSLSDLLEEGVGAKIVGLTPALSTHMVPVEIRDFDDDFFWVRPTDSDDRVMQGFSGSHVLVEGHVAGIVIEAESAKRVRALRMDRAEKMMGDFFEEAESPSFASRPEVTIRAEPLSIEEGKRVTVEWTSRAADRAVLDGESVPVNGSKRVRLSTSRKFTILVRGAGGEDQASILVDVVPRRNTCLFLASGSDFDLSLRVYIDGHYEGRLELVPDSFDTLEFECSDGEHGYRLAWSYDGRFRGCEGKFSVFGDSQYVVGVSPYPGRRPFPIGEWYCHLTVMM